MNVATADPLVPGARSDFLVIGTGDDQPGFDKLATHLPVTLQGGKIQVHDTRGSSPRSITRGGKCSRKNTANRAI